MAFLASVDDAGEGLPSAVEMKEGLAMLDRRNLMLGAFAATAVTAVPTSAMAMQSLTIDSSLTNLPGLKIAPEFYPVVVPVKRKFEVGSIHVISSQHFLYYIAKPGQAIRYGVAVGREGLQFRGAANVGRKVEWPSWKPTPEMIARNPSYAKYADGVPGGPNNPLGARAIYLYQNGRDTAIRIHGTIEPNSIGRSVSNGCMRMVNEHVTDLYTRVELGANVTVY
jgi:lipoprotein-anchoring transpeptidase ErfK/SrfK